MSGNRRTQSEFRSNLTEPHFAHSSLERKTSTNNRALACIIEQRAVLDDRTALPVGIAGEP